MSDGFHLADLLASPGEGQGGSLECGTQHRRQNAHARCLAQGNRAAIDGGWLWAEIVNETLDEHFHKRARDRGVGQDALVVTERSRRPIGRAWGIGGLREGSTCWVGRLFDQRGRSSRLRVLRPLLVHRLLAVVLWRRDREWLLRLYRRKIGQRARFGQLLLQVLACFHQTVDQSRLLDVMVVSLAGAIFALGRRASKTTGTAWLHSVTLRTPSASNLAVCAATLIP